MPGFAAAEVACSTLATKRPAGRISSISAGVLSSITIILSETILADAAGAASPSSLQAPP
nr:hypothetical protein GCM10017583_03010 [Agromyces mediolanus]